MTSEIFYAIAAVFAGASVLANVTRTSIVFYWLSAFAFGGGAIVQGCEFMGFAVWLTSALLAGVFMLHGLALGELGTKEKSSGIRTQLNWVLPCLVGIGFCLAVIVGFRGLGDPWLPPEVQGVTLEQLGSHLEKHHLFASIVLGMTALLAWVGSSFLARADRSGV